MYLFVFFSRLITLSSFHPLSLFHSLSLLHSLLIYLPLLLSKCTLIFSLSFFSSFSTVATSIFFYEGILDFVNLKKIFLLFFLYYISMLFFFVSFSFYFFFSDLLSLCIHPLLSPSKDVTSFTVFICLLFRFILLL